MDIQDTTEDTMVGGDTTDILTTVTLARGLLKLKLKLMLMPKLGMDTMDTPITADTMDTEDIMDILTTATLARDPLKLNLKLMLPLKLKLNPGTDIMVDTMAIPTDTDTIHTDMAVTGGRFLAIF